MQNKSKSSSLSTSTVGEIRNLDYSFLKQKNDKLAEEICHMKTIVHNSQSYVNFMVKEKFHLEKRDAFLREYAADIARRSRNCLNKIVECFTEVTGILKLCENMGNIEEISNGNEVSSSPTKSGSKDEDDVGEMFHPSNETNLQEKAHEPHEFPARGARRKSVSSAMDIENFETEEEVPLPIQPSINQLDTINTAEKEESNTQCLDDENTLEEDGIKDTRSSLRRMSFIERRSIGNPHPKPSTSSIVKKSLPQKSSSISRNSDQHAPSDDSRKQKLPRISLFKNDTNSKESYTSESISKEKVTSEEQHHTKNVTNKEQEFNRKDLEHCLDKSLPFNDLSNTMLISPTPMIKSKNSMIEEQRKTCAQSSRGTLKEENITMDASNEMNETNNRIRRKCTFYKYNPFHRIDGNRARLSPEDLLKEYYRSLEIKEQRKLSRAGRKQFSNMNDSNGFKETPKSKAKVVDRSRPLFNEGDEVEAHLEDHTEDTSHTADEDKPSSQKTKEISKNSSKKRRKIRYPLCYRQKKKEVMKSGISPLNNSGGRKRIRAVTNVVYKEPSLNKKLRREL